jgi:ATP phosphoribosyltransferase
MNDNTRKIRIALPSKGLLADGSRQLLSDVGLPVYNPNPRQYIAGIQFLPEVEVIFQRPGDIVISVRDGSVDFGITGSDIFLEKRDTNHKILALHSNLGFGKCTLNVIVPDQWQNIDTMLDLKKYQVELQRPLKIATKFPNLARGYFQTISKIPVDLIQAEGTLEIAPTIGYADLIVDLVSTGTTLRDNRLKKIFDGKILDAEACLIANRERLASNAQTLKTATFLLEIIGAHLRGKKNVAVFANIRANSEDEISEKLSSHEVIGGLQGPTISRVMSRSQEKFFAIHIVVKKEQLHQAIAELRDIGGSGVVVSPVNFIFEEQPNEILNMMQALEEKNEDL